LLFPKNKRQLNTERMTAANVLRLELQLGLQCCRSAAPDALLARNPKTG
jgi:hypothetical protein